MTNAYSMAAAADGAHSGTSFSTAKKKPDLCVVVKETNNRENRIYILNEAGVKTCIDSELASKSSMSPLCETVYPVKGSEALALYLGEPLDVGTQSLVYVADIISMSESFD